MMYRKLVEQVRTKFIGSNGLPGYGWGCFNIINFSINDRDTDGPRRFVDGSWRYTLKQSKATFAQFSVAHTPQSSNVKVYNLVRNARSYPFDISYVNHSPHLDLSIVLVNFLLTKRKRYVLNSFYRTYLLIYKSYLILYIYRYL